VKLHTRLVLLLAVTFGIFLSIAASIIYSVIQPAFEKLEQVEAATNVKRVQKALANEVAALDQQLIDWGNWDDTKDFSLNRTPDYIESNLNAASITNIGLSFMAFYSLEGAPIWTGGYDAETGELNTPPELSDPTVIRQFLSAEDQPVVVSGLWSVGSGHYIVAARPILDSDGAGSPAGTVVFGSMVDDALVAKLSEQTEVAFAIATLPLGAGPDTLPADTAIEVGRSGDKLTHSIAWHDLAGAPRIRIDVDTLREISAVGTGTIRVAMTLLVAAALVDMAVIGLAITLLVARPIRSLTQQVTQIAGSGDLSVRLSWKRRDELGTLAAQFDHMVGELADARRTLTEMSYKIGRSDVASGVLHNVRNALSPLANQIQRGRQILAVPGGAHVAQAIAELGDPATAPDRRAKLAEYLSASMGQESELRRAASEELGNASQGLSTIEHILAHQQATAELEVAPQDLALSEIVSEALKQTSNAAAGIAISVNPSVDRAPKVRAHQPIAVHVLHNVIANAVTAVTATGNGDRRIEIAAHYPSTSGQVVLEVRDNGIGIAPEDMPELFRNGFTTKPDGKGGEGLHWCANALAKLKGRIWAESAGKGAGATFFIEFAAP
jgi:two-component system, NtrC family, sensor kinase